VHTCLTWQVSERDEHRAAALERAERRRRSHLAHMASSPTLQQPADGSAAHAFTHLTTTAECGRSEGGVLPSVRASRGVETTRAAQQQRERRRTERDALFLEQSRVEAMRREEEAARKCRARQEHDRLAALVRATLPSEHRTMRAGPCPHVRPFPCVVRWTCAPCCATISMRFHFHVSISMCCALDLCVTRDGIARCGGSDGRCDGEALDWT
jgi:hypothetical protein